MSVNAERIRAQLKRWQERLLDLTKANPLLGLNRSRVSKLRVVEPSAYTIFRNFVLADEAKLKMPLVVKLPKRTDGAAEQTPADEIDYQVEPGDVVFEAKPVDLLRRLRRIYDNARTTVEERGVTTLYLTLGVLKWEDPLLGESVSPLWFVPCELQSFGPSAPMRLVRTDEETQLNPALELYLRERHHVHLATISEEPSVDDLALLLGEVRASVRDHGWKVEDELWLSTYSFESLVIYQDLKALADVALGNEIVIALARAATPPEGSEALGEDMLDTASTPDQVPLSVLPIDSSQLKALTSTRAGRHLVIHGPPGTGKSQTIANLIADALTQNKKVLFVSAKMAALNVVHDRLTQLGLDRFCLEAHSTKAGKAKIIEELKRTLEAARDTSEDLLDDQLQDLLRVREDLNAYVRDLHKRVNPLGFTIYQGIGKVEKLRDEPETRAPLPWDDPLKVTRAELNAALDVLADLASQADVFDQRKSHPWRGLVVDPKTPLRRDALEADLLTLQQALRTVHLNLTALSPLWQSSLESLTFRRMEILGPALSELAAIDRLPGAWSTRELDELVGTTALLDAAVSHANELHSKRTEHDRVFSVSVDEGYRLLTLLENEFPNWSRVFRLSFWRWRQSVRRRLHKGAARDLSALRAYLVVIRRVAELENWFNEHKTRLCHDVDALALRQPEVLTAAARRLRITAKLRTATKSCEILISPASPPLTEELRRTATSLSTVTHTSALTETLGRIDSAWPNGFVDGLRVSDAPLSALLARCDEVLASLPRMHEWLALQHTLQRCHALGLTNFVEALGSLSARVAPQAFERRFFTAWTNACLESSPALAVFSGVRREEQIERFRVLETKIRRSALARVKTIASHPARLVAAAQAGAGTASEIGILRRELEKRKRIKPLRKLFSEIPTVLQALKPCLLMSPLSVSTFLKPGAVSFDLVVFDEASQLPAQEVIPAILRAGQVVVAGDKNQLPPTSFFESSVIFDDDGVDAERYEDLEPLESLLDDCVAIFPVFDQTHLRWHYRSKDERLIKFSNHYFYRDRPLITFPSVATSAEDQGVRLVYVSEGVWDRGGSRTNRAEARRVAQLVVEQLNQHKKRSIGVAAMNVTQREAIEEELEELLLHRPELATLVDPGRFEPFFIKALENVQGDERDTIIISSGYGKGSTGALSFNFGPLNQEGGWRRLNVLVTRARWQTILVTSMRSQELRGVNPNNRGAVTLRDFIAYAERDGQLPAPPAVLTQAETNDFEDAVAEALRNRALCVDQQVGASEYRIDLAIRDPRDPSRYLLGVECDGATYHSAKTARDRDLLRQEVLREQGWRLYRIWSTDWFRDPDKAISGVLRAFEKALETPVEESVQAPPESSLQRDQSETEESHTSGSENSKSRYPAPVSRRYLPGTPYRKYREIGDRKVLLDRKSTLELADQLLKVAEFEAPIHRDLLLERLKEINDVARAGPNVQANVDRAIDICVRSGRLERMQGDFLKRQGSNTSTFRIPGDRVERGVLQIPPEEIELAVLHIVEDQFGYQRQALPKAVGELFGLERTPSGLVETVGTVVDELIDRAVLAVSGPNVYLA